MTWLFLRNFAIAYAVLAVFSLLVILLVALASEFLFRRRQRRRARGRGGLIREWRL